jgi:TPR repeat protein
VTKDAAAADNWYRKAAGQDFAPAEYFLAQSLRPAALIPQGGTEASRLLHRAAEQGFAPAQFELGMFSVLTPFLQALGARQQTSADAEAAQWLRKAADAGYAPAQAFLGLQHSMHIGLPEEQAEALRWFRLAADQGDMTAEEGLGALYAREHGVPPDYAESARWYLKSAEHGDATAQRRLANIYVTGLGVPKDAIRGRMWFEVSQRKFSGKDDARQRALMLDLFNLDAPKMAAADIAEAKRLAAEWSAQHPAKPAFTVERWLGPTYLSGATTGGSGLDASPVPAPTKTCTHEEQVQARLAKQNGYTGGPKCS